MGMGRRRSEFLLFHTGLDLRFALVYLIALILSVCVHEFGHAIVADKLGDRTPRSQGRVTLNPFAHADLWGTIIIPIVQVVSAQHGMRLPLMGWGKPVYTNPTQYTRRKLGRAHV